MSLIYANLCYLFLHADFTKTVKIVQKLEKMMFINMVKISYSFKRHVLGTQWN